MADGRPAAMRAVEAAAAMADQRVAAESGADTGSDEATEAASRGVRSGPDEGVHQPPADERAEPALRDAQRPLDGVRSVFGDLPDTDRAPDEHVYEVVFGRPGARVNVRAYMGVQCDPMATIPHGAAVVGRVASGPSRACCKGSGPWLILTSSACRSIGITKGYILIDGRRIGQGQILRRTSAREMSSWSWHAVQWDATGDERLAPMPGTLEEAAALMGLHAPEGACVDAARPVVGDGGSPDGGPARDGRLASTLAGEVDTAMAATMAGPHAVDTACAGPGPDGATSDASQTAGGSEGVSSEEGVVRRGPRRQRSARPANAEMRSRWLAAINLEDEMAEPFGFLVDGRVEPAHWVQLEVAGVRGVPDQLRAGGFNVQLEAERAVVAMLARHELIGLSGAATRRSVRAAEAAFGRTVERFAVAALRQAEAAAQAAGDHNPRRAGVVVIPWLLQNVGAVRRAGALAVSRVLQLLRLDIPEDDGDTLGPSFVYEVLAGGITLVALRDVERVDEEGEPTEEVVEARWRPNLPAGSRVVGWPLGPNVWVHQQAARPRLPHNPEDESHGARLFPTLGHRLWAPCAYVPLWHEGRQQLAVIRRCRTYLYLDREGVRPHLGHHDGSRDRDPVSPPGGSVAGSECDSEEDADDHGSDADEAGADGLGEDFGGEAW